MLNQLMRYLPLVSLLEKETCGRMLEVGSGIKGINRYLTEKMVIGVDVDFSGLCKADLRNFYPVKAEAIKLPFADNSIEIVVCSDTLEHVPQEDREAVIRELWRVAQKKVYPSFPVKETYGAWERRLERIYTLFKKERPSWLIDHIDKGLPEKKRISKVLRDNMMPFKTLPNENNVIHFFLMIIDEFIFPCNLVADVMSPKQWNFGQHSFIENLARCLLYGFRSLPLYLSFGSTVRKIFILNKDEIYS